MRTSYKILAIVFIFSFLLPSCNKDLQLNPISTISSASFWKTENDVNGALAGMYDRLRSQAASNFFMLGESRSEVMGASPGGSEGKLVFRNSELTRTNVGITWQGFYTVIHDANLILKYVPQINFPSEAAKNNILAQAHAMRAFVYFVMTKSWGELVIITEPTEGINAEDLQRERATVADVFSFIKEDLNKAKSLFSNNNFPVGRNMWSLPALNALIADVYLWTGKRLNGGTADFTISLNALNEIEGTDIQLLDNFASVFDYSNKGNKEILMAVRFQEFETSYATLYEYMYISGINLPGNIDQGLRDSIGALKYDEWSISELVRGQFEPGDERKKASIIEIYTNEPNGGKSYFGSIVSKFDGIVSGGIRLFLDDVIVYRYADVLLMKAEAKNALDQDPSNEINAVRKRAFGINYPGNEFVNSSKANNDDAILKERLLELIFEGKRWWDLVRFGKAFELVPALQGRQSDDHLLLFPISETTLSLETKVKQNPGY
ncbi:MAG: RagB/SusD family nutrient uptake outer membrane protein [Chitinophagaceae bacterium]|nr:RagB/SusD family nutrient uptake outer membrane protein [Chitinophagaceae bacterium]MCW5927299.1 RagB/SusD family nutrient uptake outer membrane protein [Chitinophagaceae bacterium]